MPKTTSEHIGSRRSILRAAAWAVPAVPVAVAIPALAASDDASPEATPIVSNPPALPVLDFSNFVWKWADSSAHYGRLPDQAVPYALATQTQLAIAPGPGIGGEALRH